MSVLALNRPPLICVAARVQFAPVESMERYIPALQEALRLDGYPLARDRTESKALRIDAQAGAGVKIGFLEISRWEFSNLDQTVTIRVDRESLTLLFTDYDHFANAEPHYRKILGIVESTIQGLIPQVLQLRYIGHIPYDQGASPTDWVVPSVLGMPNVGSLSRLGSVSETTFQTPEGGQLVMRCMSLGTGNLTLPVDLLPLNAKLKHPLQSGTPFILLENVHQRKAEAAAFTAASCLAGLSALRRHNAEVFQASVTPEALETWK